MSIEPTTQPVVLVPQDLLTAAQILRENGPQWRQTLYKTMEKRGVRDPQAVLLKALREELLYTHRFGPDAGADRVLVMLVPRAAKTTDEAFEQDWNTEIAFLREVYQKLTTADALFHVGLHRDRQDENYEVIRGLLKHHGYVADKDIWTIRERVSLRESENRNDFQQRLIAALDKLKAATVAEIDPEVPEDQAQIRRVLLQLCKTKVVIKVGDGRNAMFYLNTTKH